MTDPEKMKTATEICVEHEHERLKRQRETLLSMCGIPKEILDACGPSSTIEELCRNYPNFGTITYPEDPPSDSRP